MFKNAKIRIKILIGFSIVLILMLITTICVYYNFNQIQKIENEIINDLFPINTTLEKINIELVNEETGVRGYIASNGDTRYLDSYSSSKQNIDEKLKEVQKYYVSYVELQNIMVNEEIPNIEIINKYFDSQIELVKSGNIETARDRLSAGKCYMDALKHIQDKSNNGIDEMLADSFTSSEKATSQAKLLMGIIFIIGFLISLIIAILLSGMIANALKRCVLSLQEIAQGNLLIEPIKVDSTDEFGQLGNAINFMQISIKQIINSIITETENVNKSLIISNENVHNLTSKLEDISATVEQLSAGMQETAASTEEISATSLELGNTVQSIADKAKDGSISANEISKRAMTLKNNSLILEVDANNTREQIKKMMDLALNKIKEVDKIKTLADAILDISSNTNLLALNASIESARAGEAGKGFAVVAEEIRNLAEVSSKTVNEIQDTINEVFIAVESLSDASKTTLDYIETKVVKSYEESVLVGENYDKDAIFVNDLVVALSATSEDLLTSIKTVNDAMTGISDANTEGVNGINDIVDRVSEIMDRANEVQAETTHVSQSAENLKNIVSQFKI
ncbi:methyl-accepting chemotaxis protein [Clostridium chromiireducens]|uniref:Methyl-accepting chemotaxis protein McpB n=1 Tax=Clostridium chromiireducens TaxID=225345 RepID=A0A1V4IIF4_9CLOT|nr:methyl-accepting chemotaxis protein [Clostridium chromiireducens]OPJ59630.1 methyl-accepting chemotaxis protein McpB [Clostridium chromiireducens]